MHLEKNQVSLYNEYINWSVFHLFAKFLLKLLDLSPNGANFVTQ